MLQKFGGHAAELSTFGIGLGTVRTHGLFTSAAVGHSGASAGSRNGTGCECLMGGLGTLR